MIRVARFACALGVGASAACAPLHWPAGAPAASPATPPPADAPAAVDALDDYLRARAGASEEDPAQYRPWLAVLPFADDSGFKKDVWDLEQDMPRLLSGEMDRSPAWRVVPFAAVAQVVGRRPREWDDDRLQGIGQTLRADLLVTGILLDYNMERFGVGDPMIGGYKSYKGVAEIELQLVRVADMTRVGTILSQQETVDRGLGLDLLGKPREQDYQFLNLAQMEYGSEAFRATAIGQATTMAMDELVQKASQLVRPQGLQVTSGAAEILSVFGDEIFINVGSENGVHKGYRFAVYPSRERADGAVASPRVGIVEVQDIIGARVSRVAALSGAERIGVGDRLELILPEPEMPGEGVGPR